MPFNVNDTNNISDQGKSEPQPILHEPKPDYSMIKNIVIITLILGVVATSIIMIAFFSLRDDGKTQISKSSSTQIIDENTMSPKIQEDTTRIISSRPVQADIKPKEVEEKKPDEKEIGKYTIVVGSFKIKQNADKEVARLKKSGYDAWQINIDNFFRVSIGRFMSETDARSAVNKMKNLERRYLIKRFR